MYSRLPCRGSTAVSAPTGQQAVTSPQSTSSHHLPEYMAPDISEQLNTEQAGEYELGAEISKAALKAVTLRQGRRIRDGLSVCVKVIHKDQMSETISSMLNHELKILNIMSGDPSCVKLIECFETDKAVFVVMEDFATGYNDLHSLLASKTRLPEPQALHVLMQLTHFLARLHGNGVAHRDLKLPHIALHKTDFHIKVTDFSLGSVLLPGSKGFVHDQRGSPAYISPEVLSGRPYNAVRSDMWSVGVILYKLVTGRFPFNDKSHSLLFQKIKIGSFPMPPSGVCSHDTLRLLRHLLHMNPMERPTAGSIYPLIRAILAQHITNSAPSPSCGASAAASGPDLDDQIVPSL